MAKTVKISQTDALRVRVLEAKKLFPRKRDYTSLYIYEFGELTKEEITRIRAVWNLQTTDEGITANLEKLAKKFQKVKAA